MKITHLKLLLRVLLLNKGLRYCFLLLLFVFSVSLASAQRIEAHFIKDFSSDKTANKALGVGGAILLDQWVKNTTFSAHFDWAMYRKKSNPIHPNYQRLSGGITSFYSFNLVKNLTFQCGAQINYTNLRHSYIYDFETIPGDTTASKAKTVQQTGNFIGIGAHLGLHYEFTPRFGMKFCVIPTYLISVGSKSSALTVKPEYSKGIWLFPLQIGFTFKIFNASQ